MVPAIAYLTITCFKSDSTIERMADFAIFRVALETGRLEMLSNKIGRLPFPEGK